jgi:hypothetical protein
MSGSASDASGCQPDLFSLAAELEVEQERVERVNSERAEGRGFIVFAVEPTIGPDEPGYRRVFATEARTAGKAMAKVRPLVPSRRLRAYLATGVYRDELAEAEWVK